MSDEKQLGSIGRFVISGAASAFVSWATCVGLIRLGMATSEAGSAAYLASLPVGFVLHRVFSFKSTNQFKGDAWRFAIVSALSAWAAGAGLTVATRDLGLRFEVALIVTVMVVAPLNYGAMRLWVFMRKI